MKPEMLLKIREEIMKQFDVGFLEVAKYPEWVANIVPVPKKDGKVRMCVDYRDLNRGTELAPMITSYCRILISLLITQPDIPYSLSWMDSLGIIKSKWHRRTRGKRHS